MTRSRTWSLAEVTVALRFAESEISQTLSALQQEQECIQLKKKKNIKYSELKITSHLLLVQSPVTA